MSATAFPNLDRRQPLMGGSQRMAAVLPTSISIDNRLPEFGAGGFSITRELAKPTKRFADRLYNSCMNNSWFSGMMNAEGRKFNMSVEDWMSRMNTAISLYIPQVIINFIDDNGLPWETLGRNVLTWFGTIGLYAFIKNDKTSINSMFLDWFMKPDQTGKKNPDGTPFKYAYGEKPKQKNYWIKPLGKPLNAIKTWWAKRPWANFVLNMQRKGVVPKGLSFDANDLYRAAGIRVGERGMSWSRISLEQAEKIKRMLNDFNKKFDGAFRDADTKRVETPELKEKLSKFFDFFGHEEEILAKNYKNAATGEKGLVEFSRRLRKEGMKFINRYHSLTNWKTWINTLLFIFVIGDLVMRIVWATFAKLDHRGEGSNRMDPNKKPKPVEIFKFRSLPARLVPATSVPSVTPPVQQSQVNPFLPQYPVVTGPVGAANVGGIQYSGPAINTTHTPLGRQALFVSSPSQEMPNPLIPSDVYGLRPEQSSQANGGLR